MSDDTPILSKSDGKMSNPLTSCVEDSPVKTSVMQEVELGSMENGQDCGVNTSEPLASFDPSTSLWRTSQVSLLTLILDEFLETWPRAGSMQNGIVFQLVPLAPLTGETESGLWPTPVAQEGPGYLALKLTDAVEIAEGRTPRYYKGKLPTPTVNNSKNNVGASQALRNTPNLNSVVGGKLNPMWVEWLMGYPTNHTDLKDSATPSSRKLSNGSGGTS